MGPKIYNVFMGIKENGASAVMVGKRGETFLLKPEWSDLRTSHPQKKEPAQTEAYQRIVYALCKK